MDHEYPELPDTTDWDEHDAHVDEPRYGAAVAADREAHSVPPTGWTNSLAAVRISSLAIDLASAVGGAVIAVVTAAMMGWCIAPITLLSGAIGGIIAGHMIAAEARHLTCCCRRTDCHRHHL